jgi:hypothetical protein
MCGMGVYIEDIMVIPIHLTQAKTCRWAEDKNDEGLWNTSCKESFILNAGTPFDNKMNFCCFCGRVIIIPKKKRLDTCMWAKRRFNIYTTGCRNTLTLVSLDSSVEYCMFCGKKIKLNEETDSVNNTST